MSDQKMQFREAESVHAVAGGLREQYDLSDKVYSYLVYGLTVPVTENGNMAPDTEEAAAVMSIANSLLNGSPYPIVQPVLNEEDESYSVIYDAEDLGSMMIVTFYDGEKEQSRSGEVVSIDEEESIAQVVVGSKDSDDPEVVTVSTGGNLDPVEVNGEEVRTDEFLAVNEDEHEKDWWRIEELEEKL